MHLINAETLKVREFIGNQIPKYTILSHTWDSDEVTFRDMQEDLRYAKRRAGFFKIEKCCLQTRKDGYEWTWVDTCCINKDSSAELTEAINSMYKWYGSARCCYVYLQDVPSSNDDLLEKSRWFKRGWTLQELLAPKSIFFFYKDWKHIDKIIKIYPWGSPDVDSSQWPFINRISKITGIPSTVLVNSRHLGDLCVAQRMYWASSRQTTREEDLAYCLMGIFDINLPILYGEGLKKAFRRLQIQIMESTADQTIFVWDRGTYYFQNPMLAASPRLFRNSSKVGLLEDTLGSNSFHMTNSGLEISLPLAFMGGEYFIAALDCKSIDENGCELRVLLNLTLFKEATSGALATFTRAPSQHVNLPNIKCDASIAWDSEMVQKITIRDNFVTSGRRLIPLIKQTKVSIRSGADLLKICGVNTS